MSTVAKGDKVTIKGYAGTYEVRQGPDRDNEISVWETDASGKKSGWFYVGTNLVTPVEASEASSKASSKVMPEIIEQPQETQSEGTTIMNTCGSAANTRNVAVVSLIDPDKGLKPELALVKKFGTVVYDGSVDNMKMKLVMDNDMAAILAKHNEKRAKEDDLSIRQATGNALKLLPVELSDLQWVIDVA